MSASARVTLFLAAWLIYLIDRLADSLTLQHRSAKSLRQQFCLRHRRIWIGLIPVIAPLDIVIVLSGLDRNLLLAGACLSGIALIYLALNYAVSQLWDTVPLKEITVGFLFAAGTLLVLLPKLSVATPTMERSTVTTAVMFFVALCSLNCMSIAVWERDLDRIQGKHSIATRWPGLGFSVRIFCIVLAAAALLLAFAGHRLFPVAICLSASATLLAILHFVSIQHDERTALADLVLLTPVAFLCAELVL